MKRRKHAYMTAVNINNTIQVTVETNFNRYCAQQENFYSAAVLKRHWATMQTNFNPATLKPSEYWYAIVAVGEGTKALEFKIAPLTKEGQPCKS